MTKRILKKAMVCPKEIQDRLVEKKLVDREPLYSVVKRLLDEEDKRLKLCG